MGAKLRKTDIIGTARCLMALVDEYTCTHLGHELLTLHSTFAHPTACFHAIHQTLERNGK